jgi:hypothetical protein
MLPAGMAAQGSTVLPSPPSAAGTHAAAPRLEAAALSGPIRVDGQLDEAAALVPLQFTQ